MCAGISRDTWDSGLNSPQGEPAAHIGADNQARQQMVTVANRQNVTTSVSARSISETLLRASSPGSMLRQAQIAPATPTTPTDMPSATGEVERLERRVLALEQSLLATDWVIQFLLGEANIDLTDYFDDWAIQNAGQHRRAADAIRAGL